MPLVEEIARLRSRIDADGRNEERARQALEQASAAQSKARSLGDTAAEQVAGSAVALANQAIERSRQRRADDTAAECQLKSKGAAAFPDLKQRVETDQAVIRNFGFDHSADQIQQWAGLGEQARQTYHERASAVLVGAVLDGSVGALKKALATAHAPSKAVSEQLGALFKAAGIGADDPIRAIPDGVGGNKLSAEEATRIVQRAEELKHAYDRFSAAKEMATADTRPVSSEFAVGQRIFDNAHGLVSMAATFNPVFGLLSKDLDTVALAVYGTQYEVARDKVEQLTTMTESQLQGLASATKRLSRDAGELGQIAAFLKSAPQCDSTDLVGRGTAR